jgi:hypothetical protein
MEDLSTLPKLTARFVLDLSVGGLDVGLDRRATLFRRVYVRLIDKALKEYQMCRRLMEAQVAEGLRSPEEMSRDGRYIYMFDFIDHMENCVSAVRRLLRILERMKSAASGFTVPREIRRAVAAVADDVISLRGTVEHIDERIQKDEIAEDEPVLLRLSGNQDEISIGQQSLKLRALSGLLRRLHAIGESLIEWRMIGPE